MFFRITIFFAHVLFLTTLHAQEVQEKYDFQEYIDTKQKNISQDVNTLFNYIDKSLGGMFSDSLSDSTCNDLEDRLDKAFYSGNENAIDEFFQNEKFLNETNKTFIRLRLSTLLQSKESTRYNYKIRAHIPLSRTKKNFNLFIDNIKDSYIDETNPEDDIENLPDIGVNYFSPEYHGIKSRYSIGTSGLNLYARARYSKVFNTGKWTIEPIQEFKFSIKDDWRETSIVYFDRKLKDTSMLRFGLRRQSQSHIDGMDYSLSSTYYHTIKGKSGLSLSQSFSGNTKYKVDEYDTPYSGINDYSTTLNWRKSVWRKWFSYEVQPGVSFHRQYDYKANYMIRLNLDFYFGNI
ncbi:hypothetical protein N9A28_02320 [Sulfurimonas sp.]|nr:hypothetical protein [Sulfurimonas sp.]